MARSGGARVAAPLTSGERRTAATPRRLHAAARTAWQPVAGVLVVLALLEGLTRSGIVSEHEFPPVTSIVESFVDEALHGSLWADLADTMQGWAIGMAIACGAAIPLGITIGALPALRRATSPVIEFLRPIPSVALIPLAILVFGTGLDSKVFLVVYASFWPVLIQSLYGVRDVDPVALDTARAFGMKAPERLVRITLPSAAPYIATGLRIASSIALILAVTAELVIGAPGIGRSITIAQSGGALALMYALVAATGILGLLLNGALRAVERRVLHWTPAHRPA